MTYVQEHQWQLTYYNRKENMSDDPLSERIDGKDSLEHLLCSDLEIRNINLRNVEELKEKFSWLLKTDLINPTENLRLVLNTLTLQNMMKSKSIR